MGGPAQTDPQGVSGDRDLQADSITPHAEILP